MFSLDSYKPHEQNKKHKQRTHWGEGTEGVVKFVCAGKRVSIHTAVVKKSRGEENLKLKRKKN